MTLAHPVRVLHVYRTFYPDTWGGIEETIHQTCLATSNLGVKSSVFCLSTKPVPLHINRAGYDVYRRRSWLAPASCDLGGPASFQQLKLLLQQHDVIHLHFPWPFADLLHLIAGSGRPSVMTYHSDIVRQRFLGRLYAPLMWRTLMAMDAIVATSPIYAKTSPILSDPKVSHKVRSIPIGLQPTAVATADRSILDRLGILPSTPFILFLGALRNYKGLDTLMRAANQVGGRIVVAGEGRERSRVEAQQRANALENVVLTGTVTEDEKMALLEACRALVLPSNMRSEAFGVVLLEASRAGKPMVTCEIGTGTSFVNQNGKTGLVVLPDDPEALASALNTLLVNGDFAAELGRNARHRFDDNFNSDRVGLAYSELYHDVSHASRRLPEPTFGVPDP